MSPSDPSKPSWLPLLADPWGLFQATSAYAVDALQRTVLFADIERQVGDQYRAQLTREAPNVLNFPFELIQLGSDLPRPVNYGLVRILPAEGQPSDDSKRPFVVVDPRAGHGPGIGGFKPESEIGAALKAGHPCYFVGFLPDPVPGQTVEDVMHAQAAFVRKVGELHPNAQGKPTVIGNCQAGWQILMAASVWPELFGPIIVAGAPVSYWAGNNTMRYAGGLMGGSWMTALAGDVGNGRFDGAWLVQNFENLDPANTLWSKQYKVYANADTEAERYIGFEKYWGGYVYLNDVEMQYIVDNLFIGNKLSTAQLMTSDGIRIDLRNIRSPILVFSSYGDNITPPAQALGWITDLYQDDIDVYSHDQTIVYATHDSIGHLGIFVSSSVGSKEHRKFANVIDQIDLLPSGIYRATVEDVPENAPHCNDPYLLSIRRSSVEDVRGIVKPDADADRRFATAARISEINLALYRAFAQPWVRALTTSGSAAMMQAMHPMRMSFACWSSQHPLAPMIGELAQQVREQRAPVAANNPFLALQQEFSDAVVHALDQYRDRRDETQAIWFEHCFDSPWLQALAGHAMGNQTAARPHPGATPEHREHVRRVQQAVQDQLTTGGLLEASLRALFYVFKRNGEADERHYHNAMRLAEAGLADGYDYPTLRRIVREQALVFDYHGEAAILRALPAMLAGVDAARLDNVARMLAQILEVGEKAAPVASAALVRVLAIYANAAGHARDTRKVMAKPVTRKKAVAPPSPAPRKSKPAPKPAVRRAAATTKARATPATASRARRKPTATQRKP
ncbi:3-hydroxyalkanoate synthetase [Pseudoxanthomonas jiangsuensis]|uniref:DUF3141 domain-containing protein n=1 Tax=Pseudoxanthomonas jiangsuensis TaxID=619688 RepID=UPI001391174D|nr:DUF3141 domain-containing protein [Pseudoxanthomonas jiangsuensis]KAF1697303.1 3-hydroxyalkanoate synthetase [Pseudoxanthomonas jiangsuensis]